ncbi:MAG: ATP-grasp domain-containing protein [Clostridia bacterium]|nr:ATP-grasp domain-containing protein [Clostridia bacterium]
MNIAILADQPRKIYWQGEEGEMGDLQNQKIVRAVQKVLSKRFRCIVMTADKNFVSKLQREHIDMVFNLCEGVRGETRIAQVPAILEFLSMPYTGSSILGHTLSINKAVSSEILESKGVKTPGFVSIYKEQDLDRLKEADIEFPVIIKPADEGSSRGIHQDSLVYDMESLKKKVIEELAIYNPPIMINEYISGREFTVGILGNRDDIEVLPILEISYDNLPDHIPKFSSFELKCHYDGYKSEGICPAPLDNELKETIIRTARQAYAALNLRDYGRADIRLKGDVPYVLEMNSSPGLARGYSDIVKMAEASGMGYEGLVYSIVDSAIERYNLFEQGNDVI